MTLQDGTESVDMVEKEAKRLEVLKRRQERELNQLVQYELMRKALQVLQSSMLCSIRACLLCPSEAPWATHHVSIDTLHAAWVRSISERQLIQQVDVSDQIWSRKGAVEQALIEGHVYRTRQKPS